MPNSPEHVDEATATVYARSLDEGPYLASERTMYRILDDDDKVKERRHQAAHPAAKKHELMADPPNRHLVVGHHGAPWGRQSGQWFYQYVIIDIFSRYVPGWMLATAENAANA